ncbi:MAG: sulfur carrier protein ThiS [bacterium]
MKIKVNGKERSYEKETLSVALLLEVDKVEHPDMVTVQLNGKFVNKEDYATVHIKDADAVDFLYFMGGGK